MSIFSSTSDAPADPMAIRVSLPHRPHTLVPLNNQRIVVGRSAEAAFRIDSETVSRRHAELTRDPFGRWWIRDLGSRNGIRINGAPAQHSLVQPGDRIQLGECILTLVPAAPTFQAIIHIHQDASALTVRIAGRATMQQAPEFLACIGQAITT